MKRLAELLVDASGEASFTARFRTDLEQRIIIDLEVNAALPLICQASLVLYDEVISRATELAVLNSEYEIDDLPEMYEPVFTENGRLAIASLVEDELLLGFPQIPRKPGLEMVSFSTDGEAIAEETTTTGEKKNPFAALQDMLKQDKPN